MRQVFLGTPWVHAAAPQKLLQLLNSEGRWMRLAAGASIFNGGEAGEIAVVLSGLCAFSFSDLYGNPHIFALLPPGRLMGDVDGVTGKSVNVIDTAIRESEVRLVKREIFENFLLKNPDVAVLHEKAVIDDHEADMEGMIANFTLPVEVRIRALFQSLAIRTGTENPDSTVSIPYSLTAVEISELIAAKRPTVSSVIAELRRDGLLIRDGNGEILSSALWQDCYDWTKDGALPAVRIRKVRKSVSSS